MALGPFSWSGSHIHMYMYTVYIHVHVQITTFFIQLLHIHCLFTAGVHVLQPLVMLWIYLLGLLSLYMYILYIVHTCMYVVIFTYTYMYMYMYHTCRESGRFIWSVYNSWGVPGSPGRVLSLLPCQFGTKPAHRLLSGCLTQVLSRIQVYYKC